jgi:Mg2+-importing ATPase
MSGNEVAHTTDAALPARAAETDVFAEIEPNQKERILIALKRGGAVVGFLGDGINDAPALHAADVGISVDGAVDVAKEAADIVLLQHDLGVLADGVVQGRQVFANTLKYIYITTSANFGNMLSMAAAVPFLPFLPLLPVQILLNNFLSDFPAMTIGGDRVDEEVSALPGQWNVRSIRRFMLCFGAISSVFDLLTFAALLLMFHASAGEFRTAWFLVSLLTEIAILLIMRTKRPFFRSRPSPALLWTSVATAVFSAALVYLPWIGPRLGFVRLHPAVLASAFVITAAYMLASEIAKRRFFGTASDVGSSR